MKKQLKSFWNILKGFLILGVLTWMVVILLKYVFGVISSAIEKIAKVTSNIDAVIIVALITGTVSILGVILSSIVSKILEYRQNTKRYLYEKREEPYSDFIEMVYKIQQSSKGKIYTEEQMLNDMIGFSKKLTLWGSSRVIKKWITFRQRSQKGTDSINNLFILEDILFDIRKDMGQPKKGLKQGDILAFFVNDIKDHLPQNKR